MHTFRHDGDIEPGWVHERLDRRGLGSKLPETFRALEAHWDKVAACVAVPRNKASCGTLDVFAQQLPGLLETRTQLSREIEYLRRLLYGQNLTVTLRDRRIAALTSDRNDTAPAREEEHMSGEVPNYQDMPSIDRLNAVIAERDIQITERDHRIAQRDRQITERERQVTERDLQIAERDRQISLSEKQIAGLTAALAERDLRLANAEAAAAARANELSSTGSTLSAREAEVAQLGATVRDSRRGVATVPAVDQLEGDGSDPLGQAPGEPRRRRADHPVREFRPPAAEPGAVRLGVREQAVCAA